MSEPKRILFLMTDQQRWDTIHALGCENAITPNLDRLAAEAAVQIAVILKMHQTAVIILGEVVAVRAGQTHLAVQLVQEAVEQGGVDITPFHLLILWMLEAV